MSCCAPGAEDAAASLSSADDDIALVSRALGNGLRAGGAVRSGRPLRRLHRSGRACAFRPRRRRKRARQSLDAARVGPLARRRDTTHHGRRLRPPAIRRIRSTMPRAGPIASCRELLRGLAVSGFAAGNIMLLSVSVWSGAEGATRDLFHLVSALIALPALVFGGGIFFRSAWSALSHGRMNMDVPIAIGVTLAYAMSLYETVNARTARLFRRRRLAAVLPADRPHARPCDARSRPRRRASGLPGWRRAARVVIADDGSRDYRAGRRDQGRETA